MVDRSAVFKLREQNVCVIFILCDINPIKHLAIPCKSATFSD